MLINMWLRTLKVYDGVVLLKSSLAGGIGGSPVGSVLEKTSKSSFFLLLMKKDSAFYMIRSIISSTNPLSSIT